MHSMGYLPARIWIAARLLSVDKFYVSDGLGIYVVAVAPALLCLQHVTEVHGSWSSRRVKSEPSAS